MELDNCHYRSDLYFFDFLVLGSALSPLSLLPLMSSTPRCTICKLGLSCTLGLRTIDFVESTI